tara:strand:+ start:1226 stop:2752 length:1527 start_codon:yes stop_codon:yes gene_type:complete
MDLIKISSALISVYDKNGLDPLLDILVKNQVQIYSTGGTKSYIDSLGYSVTAVEDVTSYPSILGGRVKTLHPKIFGGILNRKENKSDIEEIKKYDVPQIDLVIVDLYPFKDTVNSDANESEIIEKIDIGGIALIRAAAKNFNNVVCVSNKSDYKKIVNILDKNKGFTSLTERKEFATKAFNVSSNYDSEINNYFKSPDKGLKIDESNSIALRYGENPHQKGVFFGRLNELIKQVNGKEISYNNLLDIDSAINLINEFKSFGPTFAILKHNNTCGLASRKTLNQAYKDALAGDPISAFGGVLICNCELDFLTAELMKNLFFEVIIAPSYSLKALSVLKEKKNRIILIHNTNNDLPKVSLRSCLNGYLFQDKDLVTDSINILETVTNTAPSNDEIKDLLFASIISKHTKSNTIVLVKNQQLISSGTGQTSRVDALNQAIIKAKTFGFDLVGSVMASDAFFPFPDCVEIAIKSGIKSVIQPGGSIKDKLSIDYCNENNISMVFTGVRHFKH